MRLYIFSLLSVFVFSQCATPTVDESTTLGIDITEGTNIAAHQSANGDVVFDLQGTLWIRPAHDEIATAITDPKWDARQPQWSPDGQQIVYQAYRDFNWHIYLWDRATQSSTQLTTGQYDHREPCWSSDGQQIYYSSDRAGTYDIWMMDRHTGRSAAISDDIGNEYAPHVLNQQLCYVSDSPDRYDLMLHDLTTGQKKSIYQSESSLYGPSLLTDSLIGVVEIDELSSTLILIDRANNTTSPISGPPEDVFPFRAQKIDEDVIAYTADGQIRHRDIQSAQYSDLLWQATIEINRDDYVRKEYDFDNDSAQPAKGIHCPKISPNGRYISYIALGDLWIHDLQSGENQRITHDLAIQLMPNWSPDGKSVYFASDYGGETALWSYELSSSQLTSITEISGMPSGIAVNKAGTQVALSFALGPRRGRLLTVDLANQELSQIGRDFPYSISSPSWSGDDEHLLLSILQPYSTLYREGINRIISVNISSGAVKNQAQPRHQSFGGRANDGPVISYDGQHMAYISQGLLWYTQIDQDLQPVGQAIQLTDHLSDVPSWTREGQLLYMATDQLHILDIESRESKTISLGLSYRPELPTDTVVIHAGTVITMESDEPLIDQDIVIIRHRIHAIESHQEDRPSTIFIDASDQYVMPGLIDMHAHQGSDLGEVLGRKWLAWGVTSTRDPATYPYDAQNRKEAQQAGDLLHPRIFYTGSPIDGNRVYYNGTYAQQSIDQVKRELQRAKALDYDMIKTYVRLPDSVQQMVVNYADELGVPVSSHELYPAAAYGVDGVEHIMGTSRRGYTPKMSQTYRTYADVIDIISETGMYFTPTVNIYGSYGVTLSRHPELLLDETLLAQEAEWSIAYAKSMMDQAIDNEVAVEIFNRELSMVKRLNDNGAHIIAGTDSPILPYGFGLYTELLSYEEGGLSPMETLRTATINAAVALNTQDHMGSVSTGKLADLLILDEDPSQSVYHLKSIDKILLNGRIINKTDLLTHP